MHEVHSSSTTDFQDIRPREGLVVTLITTSGTSTPGPERQSVDDESSNREGAGSNDKPEPPKPSIPLQRSVYIVFLTLPYGAAALYAWAIICILTHRPIGGIDYGTRQLYRILEDVPFGTTVTEYLDSFFVKSERHLRAARIVQAVVSVLTITLTSAVCSQAAVIWLLRTRVGPTSRS